MPSIGYVLKDIGWIKKISGWKGEFNKCICRHSINSILSISGTIFHK